MRRNLLSTDKEIYQDYLVAMILGEPVYLLCEKHDCDRKTITNVKNRMELHSPHGHHMREANWTHKYKHVQELIDKKPNERLQRALVREMYYKAGYDLSEIVQYTKIAKSKAIEYTN
jgi:hypothetical protein